MGPSKRPSVSQSPGRPASCDNVEGLADALRDWVTDIHFISYTQERNVKSKDNEKMKLYLPHLRRIQGVHRTWNFSLKTIDSALNQLNED